MPSSCSSNFEEPPILASGCDMAAALPTEETDRLIGYISSIKVARRHQCLLPAEDWIFKPLYPIMQQARQTYGHVAEGCGWTRGLTTARATAAVLIQGSVQCPVCDLKGKNGESPYSIYLHWRIRVQLAERFAAQPRPSENRRYSLPSPTVSMLGFMDP